MKAFVHTIAVILLFASCCTNTAKGNGMETFSMVDSVGGDYTANATAIELEVYQKSWTKSKSNGKEQQFTSAPDGAAVRFVQFGPEPRGKRAYSRRRRQHVEICGQVVPPDTFRGGVVRVPAGAE